MVMKPSAAISISEFLERASAEATNVTDVRVDPGWRFELSGEGPQTAITLGGRPVGALPVYQVRSMAGAQADVRRLEDRLRVVRAGGKDAGITRATLSVMVNQINAALAAKPLDGAVARTYLDALGQERVGGVVTRQYTPVRHQDLLAAIEESEAFAGAQVIKWEVNASRMEAMVLLDGKAWEVDGGLKAGMAIHNGQFGDRSYGYVAMLYRLLCTNGAMDVLSKEGTTARRHNAVGVDVRQDAATALQRTELMSRRAEEAVKIPVDVVATLIEMARRKIIGRAPMKTAAQHRHDLGGGGAGGDNLWSLAQAVSAASRRYSFAQASDISKVSGRLLLEGPEAVLSRAVLRDDAETAEELREYLAEAA